MYKELRNRLKNYKKIKARAFELELQIKELEEGIGISAMIQTEKTSKTYKINKMVENQAIELAEKKENLKEIYNINKREVEHIENAMSVLTDKQRQAIELNIIQNRSIDNVCSIMGNKSSRTINRYIYSGLKEMDDILKEEEM